jgi:hypothetical protein
MHVKIPTLQKRNFKNIGNVRTARPILILGGGIQRRPGSQRVHVVSPVHDLSFLNRYDRDEPVFIGQTGRKNLAVYFVFEDYDATFLPGAPAFERI